MFLPSIIFIKPLLWLLFTPSQTAGFCDLIYGNSFSILLKVLQTRFIFFFIFIETKVEVYWKKVLIFTWTLDTKKRLKGLCLGSFEIIKFMLYMFSLSNNVTSFFEKLIMTSTWKELNYYITTMMKFSMIINNNNIPSYYCPSTLK